jgi:hypothetical protein
VWERPLRDGTGYAAMRRPQLRPPHIRKSCLSVGKTDLFHRGVRTILVTASRRLCELTSWNASKAEDSNNG